jgi:hypothetical protein
VFNKSKQVHCNKKINTATFKRLIVSEIRMESLSHKQFVIILMPVEIKADCPSPSCLHYGWYHTVYSTHTFQATELAGDKLSGYRSVMHVTYLPTALQSIIGQIFSHTLFLATDGWKLSLTDSHACLSRYFCIFDAKSDTEMEKKSQGSD